VDFTLYKTPNEGPKLYVREWRQLKGNGEDKRFEEEAAEVDHIQGALYSEEEARQTYPEIFEELMKRAQD
jgi:hypothetical protein